jgi:hypothetical protein
VGFPSFSKGEGDTAMGDAAEERDKAHQGPKELMQVVLEEMQAL